MQLLPQPKSPILLLSKKVTKKDCKMVFLGYRTITPTGGRKKKNNNITNNIVTTATATQTANTFTTSESNNSTKSTETFRYTSNRKYDDSLCYCFHCKKPVQAIIKENTIHEKENWHSRIVAMYECPHCHQSVSSDNIFYLDRNYAVYRQYFLDENKLKIRRKDNVFRWYNNHLIIDEYKHLTTMNLDTGYSYRFPVIKNGKKMSSGIVNSTYSLEKIDRVSGSYSHKCKDLYKFYDEVYEVVRQYKMEHLNIYIPSYKEHYDNNKKEYKDKFTFGTVYLNNTPEMDDVLLFNRFPTMNPCKTLKRFSGGNLCDKEFIKLRRSIKPDTKDPIKDILDFYNMPVTKITKKKTLSNIDYAKFFYKLSQVIDNYDNINKLLNDKAIKYMSSYDIDSLCESLKIVKEIKGFNINSFCNKAQEEDKYIVIDTLRTIKNIINRKADYKFDFKGKLKDIHDKLSMDYNKLQHENIEIKYDETYKVLEGQYGDLYFNLAKDTHELIEVGTEMNICVGGYRDRAIDKKLNIVIARDENKNPVICIEMDKFYYDLQQTKLKFNQHIQNDTIEYIAIKEWAEKHSLHFNTYDVPNELKEEHNELELVKRKGEKIDALRGVDDTTIPHYARRAPVRGRRLINNGNVGAIEVAEVGRPF